MPDRQIDRLNTIQTYKNRAIDYDTYFGEMDLTERQRKERIEASEDFEEDVLFFILLVALYYESGSSNYGPALRQFVDRYHASVSRYLADAEFVSWYAMAYGAELLASTLKNISDPWYASSDRAMFNAENEANTVLNRSDYLKAILSGKTKKTWLTQLDNKVRKTHRAIGGKTIPITGLFSVGDALMRFPHDYEMASDSPEELVSCRCSVRYS